MNNKLNIIIIALMFSACGKIPNDSSNQDRGMNYQKQICLSNFLNSNQINHVEQKMKAELTQPIELQAALITNAIVSQIGSESTLSLLQSGLLTNWLVLMNQNQLTQKSNHLCKNQNGETL